MNMQVIHISYFIFLSLVSSSYEKCFRYTRKISYYKVKSCHRSELSIKKLRNVQNLQECFEFARKENGLAINFSPDETVGIETQEGAFTENCQILGCPELNSESSSLIPDNKFDYYSAFGNMNHTSNATCIESTGVFSVVLAKGNYTETIKHCQDLSADLADISSELRTNQLANLINSTVVSWFKGSYVGLDDIENEGKYISSNGNYLYCTDFRAWGPGQPQAIRKNEDCATLDVDKTWKIVPCSVKLRGVCEHFPEAPEVDELEAAFSCDEIQKKREKKRCLRERKSITELINKSSRLDKCALINYKNEKLIENQDQKS